MKLHKCTDIPVKLDRELQIYKIDYLIQRNIISAVREATRECVSNDA